MRCQFDMTVTIATALPSTAVTSDIYTLVYIGLRKLFGGFLVQRCWRTPPITRTRDLARQWHTAALFRPWLKLFATCQCIRLLKDVSQSAESGRSNTDRYIKININKKRRQTRNKSVLEQTRYGTLSLSEHTISVPGWNSLCSWQHN
jgi:hypothetical protein